MENNNNNTTTSNSTEKIQDFKHPWDAEAFRKYAHETVDFMIDYMKNVEQNPVISKVQPNYLQKLLPQAIPQKGESFETIMKDVQQHIVPGVTHWQHPMFFAYYPANTSYPSIIGDMLSSTFSVIGFNWICSPACTELETIVLDWLGKALGLPEFFLSSSNLGGGVIEGTASEAALVVLLAARGRYLEKQPNGLISNNENSQISKLVAYSSTQAHSSFKKACMIAGISNIREIETSETGVIDTALLDKTIQQDKENGLIPFFVMATIGTTGTNANDDLTKVGEICKKHDDLWMHVDAAFSGSACVVEEVRNKLMKGIEYAWSFNTNPHKWLLTNFDSSTLWVKNRNYLINALNANLSIYSNKHSESNQVIDYRDWQVPLGRRFRSLKLFFVLRSYGIEGLQEYIRHHIKLAETLEQWIQQDSRLEIVSPRTTSLICFRLKPLQGWNLETTNAKTKELLNRLNETDKVYLSHTVLHNKFIIRVSIGGAQTQHEHIEKLWNLIQQETQALVPHQP